MNTRSRTIVARNESKIRLHSEKFQMAWRARLRIANGDVSKVGWPQLKKEDIRCMQDPEELSRKAEKRRKAEERRVRREDELREDGFLLPGADDDDDMVTRGGENMREISWIWTVAGTAGTDEELEDGNANLLFGQHFIDGLLTALRIEWAKAWARSWRWTEEVRLLEEEWRRLPVTYAHRERLWVQRAMAVPVGSIPFEEAEGKVTYAARQADMYRDLAQRAEVTRTEERLQRGKKRTIFKRTMDPLLPVDGNDDVEGDEEDEDDERGDIDSDEELLMGGEVDSD
jgi:hypothetical protein